MDAIGRVDIAGAKSKFKNMKQLILAALEEGVFINQLHKKPYSYSRIDQMLREGKEWIADKLVEYGEKNPRE